MMLRKLNLLTTLHILWLCTALTIAARRRCRSLEDLGLIPALQNDSTFHSLGNPLIRSLCTALEKSLTYAKMGCDRVSGMSWPTESEASTRSGPRASSIIIDPHVTAVHGHTNTAGVYVINALYEKLYKLGYEPKARYWSELLNELFDETIAQVATNRSQQWDIYERDGTNNPYADMDNYILLQTEASNFYMQTVRPVLNISESKHGRVFQWIIGLHYNSMHNLYGLKADEAHCLGANHFLGEGLFCSSAGVISCPMFSFHRAESLAVNDRTRSVLKENIVLIDSDVRDDEISAVRLQKALLALGVNDVQVLTHKGRQRHEVPELYKRTKITIDCQNGGLEFINYEATLYDVLTLSCSSRATRNAFDYPVPSKYLIEPTNWAALVSTVHTLLVNYTQHVAEFRHFKALSQQSDERALVQLDVNFFSRDVIFRTFCESYAQCRRTVPWAVAVWTLYPLSRIEVYTKLSVTQFRLDNDVALTSLARSFNSKYFRVMPVKEGFAHPVTYFPFAPCAYVVFMHPTIVPFGRDFLNTHMHYMAAHNISQPIAYWEDRTLLVSITARTLYAKFVKIIGRADVYLEHQHTLRRIENYELYARLRGSGVWEYQKVPEEYQRSRIVGTTLTMADYMKEYANSMNAYDNTTVVPSVPLVMDMLVIPEQWEDTEPSVDVEVCGNTNTNITRSTCSTELNTQGNDGACVEDTHSSQCTAAADNESSSSAARVPYFWLTSAKSRLSVSSALSLSQGTIELIVQHLDPIIQNSLMQKIMGFIPPDVAQLFRLFDAVHFPNIVSLVDSRHQNWVDKCKN